METVRWLGWQGQGQEICAIGFVADCLVLEGVVVGASQTTYGGHYRVRTDSAMRTREVRVRYVGGPEVHVVSDGAGNWRDPSSGKAVPDLQGCIDVDIGMTPSTNTLPIKRLKLQAFEARDISVAYIPVPDELGGQFLPRRAEQRYTCLLPDQRYLYEGLLGGFSAELEIDECGIVLDYPEIFRRAP